MNPTQDVLEKRLAAIEGGMAALALSSGQAAETLTMITLASAGDEIVSTTSLYGGTYNLFHYTLPKLGINVRFVDAEDEAGLRAAINEKTKAVYTETVGNPKLDIVDIQRLADIAHENGLPLVIDNTTPSPALCRPIEHGADIVVQSLTKFIGGHGTSIGGAIIDAGKFDWKASGRFPDFTTPDPSYHGVVHTDAFGPLAFIIKVRVQALRDVGACTTPQFISVSARRRDAAPAMERHSQNALEVAKFLQNHPQVEWVNYPGLESSPYYERVKKYMPAGAGAWSRSAFAAGMKRAKHSSTDEALQPARQHRRREIAGHPPGLDHAFPVDRRGAGLNGRHPGLVRFQSASKTSATSSPTSIRR